MLSNRNGESLRKDAKRTGRQRQNRWDYKLTSFCTAKGTSIELKKQSTECKKIFAYYTNERTNIQDLQSFRN